MTKEIKLIRKLRNMSLPNPTSTTLSLAKDKS